MEKLFGKFTTLIWLITIIFIAGYIAIGTYNFYQLDDLTYQHFLKEQGLWNYFLYNYYHWETNYNFLLVLAVYKLTPIFHPLVFNVLILASNIFCFYLLMNTFTRKNNLPVRSIDIVLLSSFLMGCLYFSCRGSGNVTYWLASQLVYAFYLNYLFLGLYFWMNNRLIAACLLMFLFGHTRANYDLIFLAVYAGAIGWLIFRKKSNFKFVFRDHLPFVFFLAGMITYFIIPGNYVRKESIGNTNESALLSDMVKIVADWAGSYFLLLKRLLLFPLLFLLALAVPVQKIDALRINRRVLYIIWGAYLLGYMVQAALLYIIFSTYFGSGRVYFLTDLMGILVIFITCLYLSKKIQESWNLPSYSTILRVSLLIISIMLLGIYYRYLTIASKFTLAYQERIETILKAKKEGRKEKLLLPPLPSSGKLDYMELKNLPEDVYNYEADVYRFYYDLPFAVGLKIPEK